MVRADIIEIAKMEKKIFSDAWSKSVFEEQFEEVGWGGEVALCGDKIIGYSCFCLADNETHLTNIAVLPEYRRKLVAKRLLESILGRATESGCVYVVLEVRFSNSNARAFYDKNGFSLLDQQSGYYSNPKEDAIIMIRYLNKD